MLKHLKHLKVVVAILAAIGELEGDGEGPVLIRGIRVGRKTYELEGVVREERD